MTTTDRASLPSPLELLHQLRELVNDQAFQRDAEKAARGQKAGGVRLRRSSLEMKRLLDGLRRSVIEHRQPTRKRPDDRRCRPRSIAARPATRP